MITTQKQIRAEFWVQHPQFVRKGNTQQNSYPVDIRVAFCDFVDSLARAGRITDKLANRATL